jgi:hypothetical protein
MEMSIASFVCPLRVIELFFRECELPELEREARASPDDSEYQGLGRHFFTSSRTQRWSKQVHDQVNRRLECELAPWGLESKSPVFLTSLCRNPSTLVTQFVRCQSAGLRFGVTRAGGI